MAMAIDKVAVDEVAVRRVIIERGFDSAQLGDYLQGVLVPRVFCTLG
jgi:hypothetical protein